MKHGLKWKSMKRLFVLIFGFFLISCVATGTHKFAVFWDSIQDLETDRRHNQSYWVITDGLMSSPLPTGDRTQEIPKLARLKYVRKGLLRKMVENKIEIFTVIEFQVLDTSPLNHGKYPELNKKAAKGSQLYVEFQGQDQKLHAAMEKVFIDFNPVYMYRLTRSDLEKIALKQIEENDRELLLHLAFGTPKKVVREIISGVNYRRYYFPGAGFFYVANEIVVKKSMTQMRIE